jgi:hypothetical protein
MIIQTTPDEIFAIRQADHAAFAGFLVEHWSDHNFSADPQRETIILATSEHDNGWDKVDAKPTLNSETGFPEVFTDVTPDAALAIWDRGTKKYLDTKPFVALLITHHAYSIYEIAHKRDPIWKVFFTLFAQRRAELRNQLGLDHPAVERAYSYLRMADWFSLSYCMHHDLGAEKPEQYGGYNFKRNGTEFLFRPYPFDQRDLTYDLPVVRLRPEGYRDNRTLRTPFRKPEVQTITINPLGRLKR